MQNQANYNPCFIRGLGIEEQFYFVLPILLFLLCQYARNYVVLLLAILAALLLSLTEYGSSHSQDATFYLLPTRAQRSCQGSAYNRERGQCLWDGSKAELLNLAGLSLIALSLFIFNN